MAKNLLNKDIKEIIDYNIIKRFRKELNEIYKNLDKNITIINKKYKIYIIKLDKIYTIKLYFRIYKRKNKR
ncbi:hypothetical protein [Candidatus Nanopusillus massiliensis]|uniref:hypothetical protein n=1 Tax=Candidatus Nanopusillus massiliensis TaxID=2897163 RepID=UPI001E344BB7|nr:hypothetical protein [Candidatus Nanopusillus massiliensis]